MIVYISFVLIINILKRFTVRQIKNHFRSDAAAPYHNVDTAPYVAQFVHTGAP